MDILNGGYSKQRQLEFLGGWSRLFAKFHYLWITNWFTLQARSKQEAHNLLLGKSS